MTPRAPSSQTPARHDLGVMLTLILAGEAIFFLPFVIARVFRPTLLDVFGMTNLELGMAFSAYGVVAMLSYFPGGPLADRFGARKLMTIALVSTATGGLVMAGAPPLKTLVWLYAAWGLTTVLVFWAALIRATRHWGGEDWQGGAFGLLDGGRGLVAAAIGSIAVVLFASLMPSDVASASLADRSVAFGQVIYFFTTVVFLSALLVWIKLPKEETTARDDDDQRALSGLFYTIKMPAVWLQAIIVVCAYVAYKGLDDVSLYAKEVLAMDEISAAYASTISMWIRPPSAIIAGLIADRIRVTTVTAVCFMLLTLGSGVIAAGVLQPGMVSLFFVAIIPTSAAVFALRGLYFAIMGQGKVPFRYTGTAVGIVSAIGYTPDIFMGPLMGWLLDRRPGPVGHQHVFAMVAGFSLLGLAATLVFHRISHHRPRRQNG